MATSENFENFFDVQGDIEQPGNLQLVVLTCLALAKLNAPANIQVGFIRVIFQTMREGDRKIERWKDRKIERQID